MGFPIAAKDPDTRLQCHYFEAGRCRSCSLIETPYSEQIAAKEKRCRALLPDVPAGAWSTAFSGGDRGFRNRVKLVVGGSPGAVTLGILGPDRRGIDLRECAIQSPGIAAVIPPLTTFLETTGLPPYDVPERRGELKFVHVTESPDGEYMLRFVVRSERACAVLRDHAEALRRVVPRAVVVSVNLLPEHKAVLEGEREEVLFGSSLPMRLGLREGLTLHLLPQSFFQTNTAVARELYAQVSAWVGGVAPRSIWDLYCGVGGFALHCAEGAIDVLGVERSSAAVDAASRSAEEARINARFVAADATEFVLGSDAAPDAVIVNPPRRGIGAELAGWIERSGSPHLVYSSCNPESLARDLALMPSYETREARMFDMFPHTSHLEVALRLERRIS